MGKSFLRHADALVQQSTGAPAEVGAVDPLHRQHLVLGLPLPVGKQFSEVAQELGPLQRGVFNGRDIDVFPELQCRERTTRLGFRQRDSGGRKLDVRIDGTLLVETQVEAGFRRINVKAAGSCLRHPGSLFLDGHGRLSLVDSGGEFVEDVGLRARSQPFEDEIDPCGQCLGVRCSAAGALPENLEPPCRDRLRCPYAHKAQTCQPPLVAGRGVEVVLKGRIAATRCARQYALLPFDFDACIVRQHARLARLGRRFEELIDTVDRGGLRQLLGLDAGITKQRQVNAQVVAHSLEVIGGNLLAACSERGDLPVRLVKKGIDSRFDDIGRTLEVGPPVLLEGGQVG